MTVQYPEPNKTSTVEPKVKWATIGSYLAGVVSLAVVNALTGDDNALLLEALPDALEVVLLPFVPGVVALVSGFAAKHQWRQAEVQPKG